MAARIAPWIVALIDSLAPFIAALLMIAPFFVLPVSQAYIAAIFGGLGLLFFLGVFLGRISREKLLVSGLKMLSAGLVAFGLVWIIGYFGLI
jgi:predicted membrane protein (TIGR00267 family)